MKAEEKHSFSSGINKFLLNGEPFVIKAAELHYPRIPKEYWGHRIEMAKALGMNTICLYVFWNIHEQNPDEIDFKGQNNIKEFIELCDDYGMKVILRPGPYVCAEWEMGGLPWWLLKKKDINLRENDEYFIERVKIFQRALAEEINHLTIDNGGPIIMIQVENEYGSYGVNKEYISTIRDILRENYGDEILMFQCDWSSNFTLNALPDLLWTINFGAGADIEDQFKELKESRPESPLMCSEYWSGWFDKWGANHETRSSEAMINGIDKMLNDSISFSLYMTHGGTNWSHWAGANSPGYSPDVTSYDYDAPISESGRPTKKYWELRDILKKYYPEDSLPPVPETIETISISPFELKEVAPLWSNLPDPIRDRDIHSMESYNQGYGSILYSTNLPEINGEAFLTIDEPHDYAQIFINGSHIGTLDRRNLEKTVKLNPNNSGSRLDILVEAMGRINFGRGIKDYKGITNEVRLTFDNENVQPDTVVLKDWEIFLLPDKLDFYNSLNYENTSSYMSDTQSLPMGVYRGTFFTDVTSDTFLNFENWGKGLVYVNGHGLGRIWNIGPQQTLYTPGVWLKEGENEILIFDILGPSNLKVWGEKEPVIDKLNLKEEEDTFCVEDFSSLVPDIELEFKDEYGWQEIRFDNNQEGRYIGIDIKSVHQQNEKPTIAELYLIGKDGQILNRENWRIYASSEVVSTNNTADKIFDLQESTYWTPEDTSVNTILEIDLGQQERIKGIKYLPRLDMQNTGVINKANIYISNSSIKRQ